MSALHVDLWFVLSLFTAVFFGIQSVLLKILSNSFSQFQVLRSLFLIAGLILMPFAFFSESAVNPSDFYPPFLVSLIINIFAYTLLLTALKISPVSLVMPFVGTTPLFLIASAYFILGETISTVQFLGILLIIAGAFILQFPSHIENSKNGSRLNNMFNFRERGIGLAIVVAFLWSISASVEKLAVRASSPEIYGSFIHLSLGVAFVILSAFTKAQKKKSRVALPRKGAATLIFTAGLVSALLALSQLTAIKLTLVTNVISYKRAGILISSLIGFIYFEEKNVIKTMAGTVLILSGAYMITG